MNTYVINLLSEKNILYKEVFILDFNVGINFILKIHIFFKHVFYEENRLLIFFF